jgi:hypothetical protein
MILLRPKNDKKNDVKVFGHLYLGCDDVQRGTAGAWKKKCATYCEMP